MAGTVLWITLFLALLQPVSAYLSGATEQSELINPLTVTGVISLFKFVLPTKEKNQWTDYNKELSQNIKPLHNVIANDIIRPEVGGDQLIHEVHNFLLQKPDFSQVNSSEQFISHKSKQVEKAASIKNQLRKQAKQSKDIEEKKQFYQSIRAHNHLVKEKRKSDKLKSAEHQESLFHNDFWQFSKSVCNGTFGSQPVYPTFDKPTADRYYPQKYSVPVPIAENNLKWYPYIPVRNHDHPFDLSPIKPGDIKSILQSKSNSSAPGPDGISYGLIKKLPCLHHILATLYNKILITSVPPTLWTSSKITLIYKKGNDSDPSNFRMIALSCTFGKLFHQIMANRTVKFMTENNFIDPTIQKAFIQRINGTIEHNILLQEIIKHARVNRKTLHISFFDLEDAFGSVSHELITISLKRYKFPQPVIQYVSNLYSSLHGMTTCKSWNSTPFQFKKGIFQGDPWSPIIFLTVFNPLLEKLKVEQQYGYDLHGKKIITTPFADDFNLITTHKSTHQRIINNISSWTKSMGLKLKPVKCRSLSITTGKPTPVSFTLDNIPLDTLDTSPHKFLGSTITFSGKQQETYNVIYEHLTSRMKHIDCMEIRSEYKLKIYKDYLLPATRFILTVHELTKTNLRRLDTHVNQYLKKWSGLPRSATPAILHTDQFYSIKSIQELYEECHTIAYTSTKIKGDDIVNHALDTKLQREQSWSSKHSTICQSASNFQTVTKDLPNSSSLDQIKSNIKKSIHSKHQTTSWNHISNLACQGEFIRIWDIQDVDYTWKSDLHNLPRGVAKFLINSVLNTLPTKDNLRRWGKVLSEACGLCGNRETLGHVLSGCPVALEQNRYTWRHDSILHQLAEFIKTHYDLDSDTEIYCDAGGRPWTIPPDVLVTSDRPDLVIISRKNKTISIFELTVPFEINIKKDHQYKCHKYAHLAIDLQKCNYSVRFYAVEIGCRGLVSLENTNRLHAFLTSFSSCKLKAKDFKLLKKSLYRTAILASFIIYKARYQPTWCNTPFIVNV